MSDHEPAPLVEQIAAVNAAHYECQMAFHNDGARACDGSVIPPTYNTIAKARRAHVASQLARLVEREKHDAWDESYDAGETCALDVLPGGHARARNPYARD